MLKRTAIAILALLGLTSLAFGQSTINTGQPATDSNLNSLVVRQLALAAASDVNGLAGMHAATSLGQCPSGVSVVVGEDCLTIGSTPYGWFKWTGNAGGWAEVATINPTTGVVTPFLGPSSITASFPLLATPSGGAFALSLNRNASLLVDVSNNLGLNLANPNTWTATQTFPAGSITNSELANSTISGISLGSNLDTLTFGTHLAAGGTSYNGGTSVTISTDATSLNTASTLVARDSSGNFAAGTITASLTGHASLDLALSSLGTNVQTALGNALNASGGLASSNNPTLSGTVAGNLTFSGALTLSNASINLTGIGAVTCNAGLAISSAGLVGTTTCPGVASSIAAGGGSPTGVTNSTSGNFLFNSSGSLSSVAVIPAANGGAGTITGALKGNGAGVVSQAATSDLSDVVVPTAWTPSDQSGAALTFTSVTALYTRIGKHVVAQFRLTYPSTASGNAASVGGLPVASSSSGAQFAAGACVSGVPSNFNAGVQMAANSTAMTFNTNSGTYLNSTMTTLTITCTISYISN